MVVRIKIMKIDDVSNQKNVHTNVLVRTHEAETRCFVSNKTLNMLGYTRKDAPIDIKGMDFISKFLNPDSLKKFAEEILTMANTSDVALVLSLQKKKWGERNDPIRQVALRTIVKRRDEAE